MSMHLHVFNPFSRSTHDLSQSCESMDLTGIGDSVKEQWLTAIRSYNSQNLKEMLNEGAVSASWTYKSRKKLKHTHLTNSSLEHSHFNLAKSHVIAGSSIDDWEVTCLDVAISTDDTELLELYWSHLEGEGYEQDNNLNRSLALACRGAASSELVIKLLTIGAQADYVHSDVPVIILAVRTGKIEAVRYMLELQPDLVNACVVTDSVVDKHKFEGQSTPLHHASATGNIDLVVLLIQRGADITAHDDENGDVFFYAKHETVCESMIKEYIAMHGVEDQLKDIPLHGLVKRGFVHAFKTIINQGIKVTSDQVKINVKCLQTDSKFNAPGSSKKNISLLQLIAASDNADPFLETLPVKAIVDEFMWKYGYIVLSLRVMQFLLFLLAMTFSLVLAAGLPDPNFYDGSPLCIWRALCDIYFVMGSFMNSLFELIEFFLIWKQNFNITRVNRSAKLKRYGMLSSFVAIALSFPTTVVDYATDWYNWVDFCSGVSLILYIPLRITNHYTQWLMASFVYFFNSTLIVKYLTVSPFASYIQIIMSTLFKDLPKFILTFCFPILTFGGSFFIALRFTGTSEMANVTRTASHEQIRDIFLVNSTYWTTLLTEIRILIEQGSVIKTFYLLDLHWLSAFYLFIFTFFTLLVARAIFIAQLSNTYARSRAQADKIATKFRLDFLARLMGHGSIISLIFNVKKRFYIEEITITRNNLHNSFDSDYQRYFGDSALRDRELREDILAQVSLLIAAENAKQQQILSEILQEIRTMRCGNKNTSSLNVSLHTSHPTIKVEDADQQ